MKNIIIVSVEKRQAVSVKVQAILTEFGCMIKTRLGIHDSSASSCSENGLIILECIGSKKDVSGLNKKLASVKGVKSKLVTI
ncbi:MAG: hypothetical protein WC234_02805 [Endomicrobiaceae bacterium]